jgi:hypothetical protein
MSAQKKRRVRTLITGGAIGAGIAYFFDPDRGRGRRTKARDWTAGRFRRLGRRTERLGRRGGAEVHGMVQRATHRRPAEPFLDDLTLKSKVETELFGDRRVPKGHINVDVLEGVVSVRGQVDHPDQIQAIGERVRRIPGVAGVDNLLHLPQTPAPNKETALHSSSEGSGKSV